jgi:hypothetical protein
MHAVTDEHPRTGHSLISSTEISRQMLIITIINIVVVVAS